MDEAQQIRVERAKEVRQHLGHLDALRGFAILGVIGIHSAQWFPSRLSTLMIPGQRGVQLFFIVSAFTLMLSGDRRSTEKHATLSFFLRRWFRLAPVYYPCIVLSHIFAASFREFSITADILAVLFLQNLWAPFYWAGALGSWTLSNEALFYISLPFLKSKIHSLRSALVALMAVGFVSLIASRVLAYLYPKYFEYWTFFSFIVEVPVFFMGIAVYFLWKDHLRDLEGTNLGKNLSIIFLLITLATYVNALPLDGYRLLASSAGCATFVIALCLHPWKFLVNPVTIFLGKISYSIYLIHFFLLWILLPHLRETHPIFRVHAHHQMLSLLACYLTTLAIASAISTFTWLYVEEPGIRLGRRLIRHIQGKDVPPGKGNSLHVPVRAVTGTGNSPDAQF